MSVHEPSAREKTVSIGTRVPESMVDLLEAAKKKLGKRARNDVQLQAFEEFLARYLYQTDRAA